MSKKKTSLTDLKTTMVVTYTIMVLLGARGLYNWSISQEQGSFIHEARLITQRLWFISSRLGLEEPAYTLERKFQMLTGEVSEKPIETYSEVVERRRQTKNTLIQKQIWKNLTLHSNNSSFDRFSSNHPPLDLASEPRSCLADPLDHPSYLSDDEQSFSIAKLGTNIYNPISHHSTEPLKGTADQAINTRPEPTDQASSEVHKHPSRPPEDKVYKRPNILSKGKPKGTYITFRGEQDGPKVLLIGDSLMKGIGSIVAKNLRRQLGAETILHAKVSSGLSRPDFFDWQGEITKDIRPDPYDLAVIFMGTNDSQKIRLRGKVLKYGSKEWIRTYKKRLGQIMDLACSTSKSLLWLGLPPMRSKRFNRKVSNLNHLVRQEANIRSCVHFISTEDFLGDANGKYTPYRTIGKRYRKVRMSDGIHLSYAGGTLIASAILNSWRK